MGSDTRRWLAEREHFIREIQPKLVGIPLRRIAEATGFSLRYASLVRDGGYVPHPVDYTTLTSLLRDEGFRDESSG